MGRRLFRERVTLPYNNPADYHDQADYNHDHHRPAGADYNHDHHRPAQGDYNHDHHRPAQGDYYDYAVFVFGGSASAWVALLLEPSPPGLFAWSEPDVHVSLWWWA